MIDTAWAVNRGMGGQSPHPDFTTAQPEARIEDGEIAPSMWAINRKKAVVVTHKDGSKSLMNRRR